MPQVPNSRDLYRNLMDALYDAVLLVDDKGYVVDCNSRVMQTFGYEKTEMWDMSLKNIIRGFGPQLMLQLSGPLKEHRPVIIDGRGIRKDGSLFIAEITVGRIQLGRKENTLMAIRDVSKRLYAANQRMQEQASAKVVRLARKE